MRFFILTFFTLCLCHSNLQAQATEELTDKEKYDHLKKNIELIQSNIDSVMNQLTILKDSASLSAEYRTVLIKPIMAYESALFDFESEIGALQAQGAIYEHTLLLEQSKSLGNPVVDKTVSSYILDTEFVRNAVLAEDRKILLAEIELDSIYLETVAKIDTLYGNISAIDTLLRAEGVEQKMADSMKLVAGLYQIKSKELESDFLKKWNNIYEIKLYTYSRIMQQLGTPEDVIGELSSDGRDIKAKLLATNEGVFAAELYSYYDEKRHANQYEKVVAGKLVAQGAMDSINNVINYERADLKKNIAVDLPDYTYPTYEKVRVYRLIRYSGDGANIPNVEVPTKGSIYSIRIATFSKSLLSKSNVRKFEPLFRFENVKKFSEYYTGIYKTKKEAQADLKRVASLGFRPVVVEFKDGGKVMTDGSTFPVDAYNNVYYLEFDAMDDTLNNLLKELAPTKQITLVDNKIYSLGVFDDYNELAILQEQLKDKGRIVKVKL